MDNECNAGNSAESGWTSGIIEILIMLKISNGMFEKIVVQNSLQLEQ
jgi:hypothetical protein